MGQLFCFISDDIARTAKSRVCECCNQSAALFPIRADIENDEWSYSSEEVESLCAICIRRLPLRKLAWRASERVVQQMVNAHYPKGTLNGAERQSKLVSICDESVERRPFHCSCKTKIGRTVAECSASTLVSLQATRNRFKLARRWRVGKVISPSCTAT